MSYDFKKIESRWKKDWEENKVFVTSNQSDKPKYYALDMFPYPSGQGLHVGHLKGYVASDVLSRFKRMQGFNVLHPMGWDAFGLPAERQAMKDKIPPAKLVARNVATFKDQLVNVGISYDWEREFATTDKDYYKWTQWIFKQLYDKGLAYQAEVAVNWCPALSTVLANEEVKDGYSIATQHPVEKRFMKQWLLRITAYAEQLLDDLDQVDWPESVKDMQRNWIGRSEGTKVKFKIKDSDQTLEIFTTRADTLFGCTYCVMAPEHPLIDLITSADNQGKVRTYVNAALKRTDRERQAAVKTKTGVFTGAMAVNPVNGQEIPILISDYVLSNAGTGIVYGCPAHDERDYEFAKAFNLPLISVVQGGEDLLAAYTGDGPHINSGFLNGLNIAAAKACINDWLETQGLGERTVTYRFRDWLFSRQRYWGEPFPIVYDEDGKITLVPDSDLPVELPEFMEWSPETTGEQRDISPLAANKEWVNIVDPETGRPAFREVMTMPQWAGSCWYYLRFCDPHNNQEPWSKDAEKYWMPVDFYIGGVEHATLHLLYARFWHKVLYDIGAVSTKEPFKKLFNQGLITARSYCDAEGQYYYPDQVEKRVNDWFVKGSDTPLATRVEKMSKSLYNVTRPDDIIKQYGADTLRIFEMALGPIEKGGEWVSEQIAGPHRFLERVHGIYSNLKFSDTTDPELEKLLHRTIKKVTADIEAMSLNTAVSQLMVLSREISRRTHTRDVLVDFAKLLSPFAPFLADECRNLLGEKGSSAYANWPSYDPAKAGDHQLTVIVQVDGKLRATINAPAGATKDELLAAMQKDSQFDNLVTREDVKKIHHVPDRVINYVFK